MRARSGRQDAGHPERRSDLASSWQPVDYGKVNQQRPRPLNLGYCAWFCLARQKQSIAGHHLSHESLGCGREIAHSEQRKAAPARRLSARSPEQFVALEVNGKERFQPVAGSGSVFQWHRRSLPAAASTPAIPRLNVRFHPIRRVNSGRGRSRNFPAIIGDSGSLVP